VTTLQAGRFGIRIQNNAEAFLLQNLQTCSGATQADIQGYFSPVLKRPGCKVDNYVSLLPRLRKNGALPCLAFLYLRSSKYRNLRHSINRQIFSNDLAAIFRTERPISLVLLSVCNLFQNITLVICAYTVRIVCRGLHSEK